MKQIGIYDPYFHILGGAERYVLSIAHCLKANSQISLFTKDDSLLATATQKFGIETGYIHRYEWPVGKSNRIKQLARFDLFFYVTDGSIFISPARKNILIIQSPAHIPL